MLKQALILIFQDLLMELMRIKAGILAQTKVIKQDQGKERKR